MKIERLSEIDRKTLFMRGANTPQVGATVAPIVADVAARGDEAVLDYTERFDGVRNQHEKEQRLEVIERDNGKCILCGLCVRVCDEVAKQGILGLVGRGFPTAVKPEFRSPETIRICAECGKCAAACPTGALRLIGSGSEA